MDRILQGVDTPISITFTVDGTAQNPVPDATTVRIVNSAGVEIVPESDAVDTGTGSFEHVVTAAQAAELDTCTVYWTASFGSTPQTVTSTLEIVGGFLFSISDFRALPGQSQASLTDIFRNRLRAEQALERRLGVAFVPRYRLEKLTADGGSSLMLAMPRVRALRSISVDGTALTASDLDSLAIGAHTITGRTWRGNLIVGYEHGWDAPEEPIRDAALALARYYLTTQPGTEGIDPRIAYITTPEGRINYGFDGLRLPEVASVIQGYDMSVGVA